MFLLVRVSAPFWPHLTQANGPQSSTGLLCEISMKDVRRTNPAKGVGETSPTFAPLIHPTDGLVKIASHSRRTAEWYAAATLLRLWRHVLTCSLQISRPSIVSPRRSQAILPQRLCSLSSDALAPALSLASGLVCRTRGPRVGT